MLTRKKVIAVIVLVVGCWLLPRVGDALAGNTTVVFYGQVESNNGFAIEGAKISAEVLGTNRLIIPCFWGGDQFRQPLTATSGPDGRFTLKCDRGHSLIFRSITKPDYDGWWAGADQQTGFFRYRSLLSSGSGGGHTHVPDRGHPVVFRLPYHPIPPARLQGGEHR